MAASSRSAASAAICVALSLVAAGQQEPFGQQVERLARPLIDEELLIGVSIGVLRNGQAETFGFGRMSADRAAVPDGRTIYEIGSVTKVFTSILLAVLAEEGTLSLDDPVQKFLPAEVQLPLYEQQPIRLVHLATHTSALPRLPQNFQPADPGNPYADYTVGQMYACLSQYKLLRGPGETHGYSNLGVGLLGHALARADRCSYEQLLVRRLARPLELHQTRIGLTPDMRERLAPGHNADGKPQQNWDIPTLAGAGGLRSNVDDMLRFLAANLSPPEGPLGRAIALTHQPRQAAGGGLGQIGLGWYVSPRQVRHHSGQTGGYHSYAAFDPERKTAVVVLANSGTGRVDDLGQRVLSLAAGEPVEPPAVRRSVAVERQTLERYVGTYAITPAFALSVTLDGQRLWVQATGQDRFRVDAESPTRFFYRVVDAQLTFVVDPDGAVRKLILHQNGRDLEGTRQPQ